MSLNKETNQPITFVIDPPLMMAKSRAESTRDTYNYGQYLNQFPPNTIKIIREFERIQKKICWQKMSIMFNKICINEEILPKYTPPHTQKSLDYSIDKVNFALGVGSRMPCLHLPFFFFSPRKSIAVDLFMCQD